MNALVPLLLCVLLCLAGCGPKEIGEDSSDDFSAPLGVDTLHDARFPMDNNPVQQRLYLMNQPDRMIYSSARQKERMLYRMGVTPENRPDPTVPRQRSPFRDY